MITEEFAFTLTILEKCLFPTVVTAKAKENFRRLAQESTYTHEKHSQTHAAGMVSL